VTNGGKKAGLYSRAGSEVKKKSSRGTYLEPRTSGEKGGPDDSRRSGGEGNYIEGLSSGEDVRTDN